jgi:phage terminase small subunit
VAPEIKGYKNRKNCVFIKENEIQLNSHYQKLNDKLVKFEQ